ncbi:hypothetical protein FACS1894163_03980 [Spirochaetia bacterium]|nr:hypothetical protein FACS1894163_03980 [Spirochaetia bacterium]
MENINGENRLLEALDRYITKNLVPDLSESTSFVGSLSSVIPAGAIRHNLQSDFLTCEAPNYEKQKTSPLHRKKSVKYLQVEKSENDISSYIESQKNRETFSVMLNRLREERGLEPPELYKAADIDRKLYSRIMGERDYKPSKTTVISFSLALKLSDSEMDALLESAGYALSRSVIFDLVISFCVENMIYSIPDVNALLLARNEPLLR